MRINEISGGDKWYRCRVRVEVDGTSSVVNIRICCDSRSGLMAILARAYGKRNVLACNEISGVLSEKIHGAPKARILHHDAMNRRPYSPPELKVKSLEKKARDSKASGDTDGAAEARAQVALQKAQNKKNAAQLDYTKKATKLSNVRASV
jgi:hypothetical protein